MNKVSWWYSAGSKSFDNSVAAYKWDNKQKGGNGNDDKSRRHETFLFV